MLQLIFNLLIMSGIGALLALLLEIANAYIADYGESHILINEEKDLLVKGGSPLLFSLMEEEVYIPSACGGRGTCSYCKLKVMEGGGPVLPTETPYLSPDEIADHVRLSCQVKVRNDLKIEIPEELFLVKEFRVIAERVKELTPDIRELRLKILSPEPGIKFKAGQYVQLQVPRYALTKGPEFRAYSIASSAADSHNVDLAVTKVEEGAVSGYVHDYLKEGEELTIIGPYGEFYLRDSDREILLIATGSGLAPIKSILHQMEEEQIARKTRLFFGDRMPKDLFYTEELKVFEERIPDFSYIQTLSRVEEGDKWQGERGRVTDLIEKYIPERARLEAYICGSPAMVQSCVDLLIKKEIPEECICFDKFE
ncbi:NADH:ubiquinone reductase (Na(+)-transporting) subunit F [Thermodesulfobacteriota bacterium]